MGTLPQSRPRTYGNETPIVPADLNDLFDCSISSKHDELEYPFDASAFVITVGAPTFDGVKWSAAGAFQLIAPVRSARVGDRITRVRFTYNRQNAGHIVANLNKHLQSTWALTVLATNDDAASGAVITVKELPAVNHVVATGELLQLVIAVDATAAAAGALVGGGSIFLDCL